MAESNNNNNGYYKKISLSDSLSFLLPSSDNEEFIYDVKQPSLSSVNLTDSVCSSVSLNNNNNSFKNCEEENTQHKTSNGNNNFSVPDFSVAFFNSTCNSEPEDMQDFGFTNNNNNNYNTSGSVCTKQSHLDILANSRLSNGSEHSCNLPEKCLQSFGECGNLYTSSPLSFCSKKKSISLQDVSEIEIFPLIPKTTNGFSTETIQSQSLASTAGKSKDSGIQRSASCLSLNSGNRSYEHVQSKVKQYIKDIKDSEAQRKKQQQHTFSISEAIKNRKYSEPKNKTIIETDESKDLLETIMSLKSELQEKDTTLNELQRNYNSLLKKYAEAVNQIDIMRLRTSFNYSPANSDLNGEDVINNYNNTSINNFSSNFYNIPYNKFFSPSSSNIGLTIQDNDRNHSLSLSKLENYSDLLQNSISLKENSNNISNSSSKCSRNKSENLIDYNCKQKNEFSTVNKEKNSSLKPISRMYSSSSRLDRTVSPLPPSSLVHKNSSSSGSNNNNCNNNSNSDRQCLKLNNNDNNKTNLDNSPTTVCNEKIDDNKSGTLIWNGDDHHNTAYLDYQSISQLELPKDDPFDKVKKWQASLPSISLLGSQSSSSIGSNDNIDLKTNYSSLTDDLIKHADYKTTSDKNKKCKITHSLNLSKNDKKSATKNQPKMRTEFYDAKIRFSSFKLNISSDKSSSSKVKINRKHKNILKRSNAITNDDYEDSDDDGNCDINNKLKDDLENSGSVNNLPILPVIGNEQVLSLGSSKQNYNKDNMKLELNERSKSAVEKIRKEINNTSNKSKDINLKRSTSLSHLEDVTNKSSSYISRHSKSSSNNKRICFQPVNQAINKLNKTESLSTTHKLAWGSPKHNTALNYTHKTTPGSSQQKLSSAKSERTEKLKRYTQILKDSREIQKKSIDIGIQVSSDDSSNDKFLEDKIPCLSAYENLEECDQYVKYILKKMKKISGILEDLQITSK